jgi:hypothetical protein
MVGSLGDFFFSAGRQGKQAIEDTLRRMNAV